MMIIAQSLRGRNLKDEKGKPVKVNIPKKNVALKHARQMKKIELGGNSNMTRSPKTIDVKK